MLESSGHALHGVITNPEGVPLSDVRVRISRPDGGMPFPRAMVLTDELGRFHFPSIVAGEYGLEVYHSEFIRHVRTITLSKNVPQLEVKIQLERGNWISGRVVDHSGRPVAGVQICATNECLAEACTDSNGRFTAQGLGGGTVSLSALVPGSLQFTTGPKVEPNTTGVEIRLEEGFSIEFQVVSSPLPKEYSVTILESANRALGISIDIPEGACGKYELKGVPAGEYEIQIESKGYQPVNVTRVLVPGGKKRITVPIQLVPL